MITVSVAYAVIALLTCVSVQQNQFLMATE